MAMHKKADISQVFVYIMTLIILALVMFYGYKAIAHLINKSEELTITKIQKQVSDDVKKISSDYGSSLREDIFLPSPYIKICFVDLNQNAPPKPDDLPNIIYDSWSSKAKQNMFFLDAKNRIAPPFYAGNIEINNKVDSNTNYYLCIPSVKSKVSFMLTGTGNSSVVS